MDQPDVLHRRQRRDRLVSRVSVMGQVSALLAMASTGVTAGVLAHDAQLKDRQAAQAKAAAAQPSSAPAVVRLVPKPIRTVLVRVPAPARRARPHQATSPVVRRTVVQAAPRQAIRTATKATTPRATAPKPASRPAATTSSGS